MKRRDNILPGRYQVLPYSIEFAIKGFNVPTFYPPDTKVFSLHPDLKCDDWFKEFAMGMLAKVGMGYYPICRLSDGEFLFLFDDQPPVGIMSIQQKVKYWLIFLYNRIVSRKFHAFTGNLYSSGIYSKTERVLAHDQCAEKLRFISERGALALHLSYNINIPFQEKFFPALKKWLQAKAITLTDQNYYQFYFVYAFFASPYAKEFFMNRRVLVVHGARGSKKEKIINGLYAQGVSDVKWCSISENRSLHDSIDVNPYSGQVDLCLVGAGIGKISILPQLEPLNVLCVDAGYFFEIWADPERKWDRVYCYDEEQYESCLKLNSKN